MKKILIGILALIMILGLVGCSSSTPSEETNTTEPTETTEQVKEGFDKSALDWLEKGIDNVKPYYCGTYVEGDSDVIPEYVENVWTSRITCDENYSNMFLAIYEEKHEDVTSYFPRLIFNYQDSSVNLIPILSLGDIEIKTDSKTYTLPYDLYHGDVSYSLGTNLMNGGLQIPSRVFSRIIIWEEDRAMIEDIIASKEVTVTSGDAEWTCTDSEIGAIKEVYEVYTNALNGEEIIVPDYYGDKYED